MIAPPTTPALEELAARNDAESFEPGEPIFRELEPASLLFLVIAGEIGIERGGRVLRELAAGDFFGAEALFGESVRTTTARATTPATVVPVGLALYARLAAADPGFAARVQAARHTEERLAKICAKRASTGRAEARHPRQPERHSDDALEPCPAERDQVRGTPPRSARGGE